MPWTYTYQFQIVPCIGRFDCLRSHIAAFLIHTLLVNLTAHFKGLFLLCRIPRDRSVFGEYDHFLSDLPPKAPIIRLLIQAALTPRLAIEPSTGPLLAMAAWCRTCILSFMVHWLEGFIAVRHGNKPL